MIVLQLARGGSSRPLDSVNDRSDYPIGPDIRITPYALGSIDNDNLAEPIGYSYGTIIANGVIYPVPNETIIVAYPPVYGTPDAPIIIRGPDGQPIAVDSGAPDIDINYSSALSAAYPTPIPYSNETDPLVIVNVEDYYCEPVL